MKVSPRSRRLLSTTVRLREFFDSYQKTALLRTALVCTEERVELVDLKTGRMNLETRTRRLADQATPEDKQRIKNTVKYFPHETSENEWHHLQVQVMGDTLTMLIDGKKVGSFQSPGIGHPTKSRLRIAVNREAWIDDVEVIKLK